MAGSRVLVCKKAAGIGVKEPNHHTVSNLTVVRLVSGLLSNSDREKNLEGKTNWASGKKRRVCSGLLFGSHKKEHQGNRNSVRRSTGGK